MCTHTHIHDDEEESVVGVEVWDVWWCAYTCTHAHIHDDEEESVVGVEVRDVWWCAYGVF